MTTTRREPPVDLHGRTVVVTGASSGIGEAAARRLAAWGATVAVVGRSPERTAAVAREIGADPYVADFTRLDDVRTLAAALRGRYPTIDVLANNAGLIAAHRRITPDGHETTFQVNHLAPFLLTNLLLDPLAAAGGRVISTASLAYRPVHLDLDDPETSRRRYRSPRAYAESKLALLIFARELARRCADAGVTSSAFHPGTVRTAIAREHRLTHRLVRSWVGRALLISPQRGAQPLIHLATTPRREAVDGTYLQRMRPVRPRNRQATDLRVAARLWDLSAELTGV